MMYQFPFKKQLIATSILMAVAPQIYAETEKQTFDEVVVVSASKTPQAYSDVSTSISKIDSDEFEKTMANDIKQAVKYMPGVEAEGSGRFGLSGFNIRGMNGSRVKIMVDGVQQPVAYNPGAGEQRKYPNAIEVDTLATIEVNKGASSSLFGSDAVAGAVVMRTKNPDDVLVTDGDEHRFGIKTGYSSADENFKTTATWAMRQDKLETLLMLTYADGSETKTHGSGADVVGDQRGAANPASKKLGNVLAKAFYQVNDNHRIGFTGEYYDYTHKEDELSYYGISIPSMGFIYNSRNTSDENKRFRAGFEHEWQTNSVIADDLKWSVNYQDSRSLNKNFDNTNIYGDRLRQRDAQDQSWQFDTQLHKQVDFDTHYHLLTYGGNYKNNKFQLNNDDFNHTSGGTVGSTGVPDATTQNFGLFIEDQIFLMNERLVVNAGLRYDNFKTDPKASDGYTNEISPYQDDDFSAKLGAVYHLSQQYSVFGQVSQGFKAPTVHDLYYTYSQGAIIEANPNLKSERSTSYEVGFRSQSNVAKYELVGFYNQYTDFISSKDLGKDPETGRDRYTMVNLDNVDIRGVEFSSDVALDELLGAPAGLYSRFSLTYTDGEDKSTGEQLDTITPLRSVFALGYDNVENNWGLLSSLTMASRKTEWQDKDSAASEKNVDAPGYAVVDLTAYYRPMKDMTLRAGLFNAFDAKYWLHDDLRSKTVVPGSMSPKNYDIYSQPGRNWSVTLEYLF
ncbi:TonB-dependent heme and hemoglobin receptor HutA [Vibrio maritimus]|uniref:TonB-dependent heme and hemoglobin receptor HutA n=1 Tax=Vibrio maritimus TaxID=990268 RepID=A0A090RSP3_9VIBR|nr:TonB-dependent heme and hemoglobin receptor HutA [Vibrio maritimus]